MTTSLITERVLYNRSENGTDVYVLRTPTQDVVTCMMAFRGAGVFASYDSLSVIRLLEDLIPSGTKKHSRTYILEKFETLGAQVAVSHNGEYLLITLTSRSGAFLESCKLLFEVLADLKLTDAEVASSCSTLKNEYMHIEENTRSQALIALRQALYSKGHPQWVPTTKTRQKELSTITRERLQEFHTKTLSTIGSVICVVGDVNPTTTSAVLLKLVGSLPHTLPQPYSKTLSVTKVNTAAPSETIIPITHKENVDTFVGIPVHITRDHDAFQAFQVGVSILGSSFTSRLFTILRTQKNLTYGSYASLEGFLEGYPGFLSALAIFPTQVFVKGKTELENVVREFVEHGITTSELREQKEELIGKFKVGLSTTAGMCGTLFGTVLRGKPVSYIDEYSERISALTIRDVNQAIQGNLDYHLAKTTAAGGVDKDGKPL